MNTYYMLGTDSSTVCALTYVIFVIILLTKHLYYNSFTFRETEV